MSVPRAEPLQAFLGGAPPTLARSDYEHAVRPQRLEQRILRIAREVDHDLLGPDTAGHLPGLLPKDAQGNLRMPQVERKRHALHPQDADSGRYLGGQFLRFLQRQPGELGSGVGNHDVQQIGSGDRFSPLRPRTGLTTGLELYKVRRLAELQHGRVWVADGPGDEARFGFALPLAHHAGR